MSNALSAFNSAFSTDSEDEHNSKGNSPAATDHTHQATTPPIPSPLRLGPKQALPDSRIATIVRCLHQSASEREQRHVLQQLLGACDHSLRTWQSSSVDPIIEQFETRLRPSSSLEQSSSSGSSFQTRQHQILPSTSQNPSSVPYSEPRRLNSVEIGFPERTLAILVKKTQTGVRIMSEQAAPLADTTFQIPGSFESQAAATQDKPESSRPQRPSNALKLQRNKFGLSEASIVKPESSQIAAEGKMEAPNKKATSLQDLPARKKSEHVQEEQPTSEEMNRDPVAATSPFEDSVYEVETPMAEPTPLPASESATVPAAAPQENSPNVQAFDTIPTPLDNPDQTRRQFELPPPDIQVHSPSNPVSEIPSPALDMLAMTSVSSVAIPSAPYSLPALSDLALNDVAPSRASGDFPMGVNDPSRMIPVLKVPDIPLDSNSLMKAQAKLPLNSANRVGTRKKAVRRVRKLVLRKTVLEMLLGHELGGVVYASMNQAQAVGGIIDVSFIGAQGVADINPVPIGL